MSDIDEVDRTNQCVYCQVGDCDLLTFGYPFCSGCGDHHREPVAEPGERCPVDLMTERWAANEAAGRDYLDDGDDVIEVGLRALPGGVEDVGQ